MNRPGLRDTINAVQAAFTSVGFRTPLLRGEVRRYRRHGAHALPTLHALFSGTSARICQRVHRGIQDEERCGCWYGMPNGAKAPRGWRPPVGTSAATYDYPSRWRWFWRLP